MASTILTRAPAPVQSGTRSSVAHANSSGIEGTLEASSAPARLAALMSEAGGLLPARRSLASGAPARTLGPPFVRKRSAPSTLGGHGNEAARRSTGGSAGRRGG